MLGRTTTMTAREVALQEAEADSNKTPRQLLDDINTKARDLYGSDKQVSQVLASFAALLVAFSRQADRIQQWMVILTVSIAVMTLVLVGLTIAMLIKM